MSAYKNYKEQFDILFRNIVSTIKIFSNIRDGEKCEFNNDISIGQSYFVEAIDENFIYMKDGTFSSVEQWPYEDFSIRELLKILEQLELKNYD